MKRVIYILSAILLLVACNKEAPQPVVHELTPIEQTKQNLDSLGANLAKTLNISEDDNLLEFLVKEGKMSFRPLGTVNYTLEGEDGPALEISLSHEGLIKRGLDIIFYPDMEIQGTVDLKKIVTNLHLSQETPVTQALDACVDLTLYYKGEPMATLGLEPYHESEAGEDRWSVLPVFRFKDGTSYSISSVVLIDQFIDYFLKHEGSRA